MSFSPVKETTDESFASAQKNEEAQNFLPNVMEHDDSSKTFSNGSSKLGKRYCILSKSEFIFYEYIILIHSGVLCLSL